MEKQKMLCVSVGGVDLSGNLPDKNRPGGMTGCHGDQNGPEATKDV